MPEGLDSEVGADGHVRRPLSIDKALDDVLVVYEMNGEPLPPDHGYPARLLELPLPAVLTAGEQRLTGRSWSATGAIGSVEVSVDGGTSWRPAELEGRNIPQAWAQWSVTWRATPGEHVPRARATDTQGNVQAETTLFNENGYLFGAVVKHPVSVV